MSVSTIASDIDVASAYAKAYAGFDTDQLRRVLAPDLVFRQVNPGGYLPLGTAEAYIEATADFMANFDSCTVDASGAEVVGTLIVTTSRCRLTRGSETYFMQHNEIVTVRDGRVVAIDSVCTGATPA